MAQYVAPPIILHQIMAGKGVADKFGEIKASCWALA
jgi:hypothetical protein